MSVELNLDRIEQQNEIVKGSFRSPGNGTLIATLHTCMRSRDEFIQIIQLGPADLKQCQTYIQSSIGTCYLQIMIDYYESCLEPLNTIPELSATESTFLKIVVPLRIAIRNCTVKLEDLIIVENDVQNLQTHFQAEIYFVAAMAYEVLKNDEKAFQFYQKSFGLLSEIAAFSKASKAFHNAIAAESRLEKYRHRIFIPDYLKAFEFSSEHKDILTAGMALTNVSKEYHRLGHSTKALKYALKSFRVLEKEMNTYNFHLSTLNLCQLLIEARKFEEAEKYFKLIEFSPYPDVLESIKVLFSLCNGTSKEVINQDRVPQNWILKLEGKNNIKLDHFSEHERILIEKLANGPQSKEALIKLLYGTKLDFHSAEQRFKNLMIRLRKKSPHIIEFKNQRYHLRAIA